MTTATCGCIDTADTFIMCADHQAEHDAVLAQLEAELAAVIHLPGFPGERTLCSTSTKHVTTGTVADLGPSWSPRRSSYTAGINATTCGSCRNTFGTIHS